MAFSCWNRVVCGVVYESHRSPAVWPSLWVFLECLKKAWILLCLWVFLSPKEQTKNLLSITITHKSCKEYIFSKGFGIPCFYLLWICDPAGAGVSTCLCHVSWIHLWCHIPASSVPHQPSSLQGDVSSSSLCLWRAHHCLVYGVPRSSQALFSFLKMGIFILVGLMPSLHQVLLLS